MNRSQFETCSVVHRSVVALLLSKPVLVLLALVSIIGAAPFMPLFDLDEGAFSEATRELLASGNWVSTYLNGAPRYDKPILIYWFQAVSAMLFDLQPLALRLPSMLAAAGWLFVVYRFVREFFDETTARFSVWLLASSWLASVIFKAATADALLNFWLHLIFFDLYRYCHKPDRKRLLIISAWMGLGFLTKGPVVLVLPIATSLLAMASVGRFNDWCKAVLDPLAWLPLLAIIMPWHIAIYVDQGWGFYQGFYLGHNLGRFSDTMETHGGSVFYYLLFLPLLFAPFTGQLVAVLAGFWRNKAGLLRRYLWLWFGITFLLFSFSKTQLPHYLLYGMTPVFIFIAQQLTGSLSQPDKYPRWQLLMAALGCVLFVALPMALVLVDGHLPHLYEAAVVSFGKDLFLRDYVLPTVAALVAVFVILALPRLSHLARQMLLSVVLLVFFNFVLLPLAANSQQLPVREAGLIARDYPGRVVSYQTTMPSISVYAERIIRAQLPLAGDLVFTRKHAVAALEALEPGKQLNPIYQKGGIALYRYGD